MRAHGEPLRLSPCESLRAATVNAAMLLRREAELGSIEVGKYADIIACTGDPLEDMEELTRLAFVMKGGQIHRHEQR